MLNGTDLIYSYDGSFEGLLCCVFESYSRKEMPSKIITSKEIMLFDPKIIQTDFIKAKRVLVAIKNKISYETLNFVYNAYLTCLNDKELHILMFVRLAFKNGKKSINMIEDNSVYILNKAIKHLLGEVHSYLGFLRFSIYGDVLFAQLEPKNYVLPLMKEHFCDRFNNEKFIIYDITHNDALIYQNNKTVIACVEKPIKPKPDETELYYRKLWKKFYDTIAIKERINPRRQMGHMPKRYWEHLTEFADE